jgi:hypothetical protein
VRRCGSIALAIVCLACAAGADGPEPAYVQAVEFPYYLCPRANWERELVWLKNIGVRTVEFSIPWNWQQVEGGGFDFTGRTSPRRDLAGFVRVLRRLGLQAWIRPLPPVAGWPNEGRPADARAPAQRAWLRALADLLATQTASHGGPIAYVEGRALAIDAAAPPSQVTIVSATEPDALARSRDALAAGHPLLWTDVEDALYPAGWEPGSGPLLRKGAVGLSGDERPAAAAVRRDAALLRHWDPLIGELHRVAIPKPEAGRLPQGVTAVEMASGVASAVSITNRGKQAFHDELRVSEPWSKRTLSIPGVTVPPGESLWLPVTVSLGPEGLCRECSNFSPAEHIVYATAELLAIEYENGILAMEFAAPQAGEAILQLARKPVGPYLAAGKPTDFDWDDKTLRGRFPIPAGTSADKRVRVGIAMEEPDTSAFFDEARRLMIGEKNTISTSYSSPGVAARSRLLLPEGYTAAKRVESPNEIDYDVSVPAEAVAGDRVNLTLEADGMPLGRAQLQLFRPATVRLFEAIPIHFGDATELPADPPAAPLEPKAGSNVEILLRNNWPQIQTYRLAYSGDGLEFMPAKSEISVGPTDERRVTVRVFAKEGVEGLRDWHVRVTGAANADVPMRAVLVPRGRTVAWSADLDGDGTPEWVLESQKARAVFSTRDGGRWMEFTWKDTNTNFLPEGGAFAGLGPVEVRANGDTLEFTGKGWKRTARLVEATLTVAQSPALPADGLTGGKRGNIGFSIERAAPGRAVYTLR